MDPEYERIMKALRAAHAAGDTESAARLAKIAKDAKAKSYVENVIATTPDGGRVIKGQDGKLSFASSAYSTSDPAQIAKIMEGATPAEVSTSSFDQSTIAKTPAKAAKFIQGIPFVGQYADEAVGAVFGDDAKSAMRASQNAMDRENPVQSAGLQVLGGIAGAIPMALAAGPAILAKAPTTMAGKVIAGAVGGGVAGATEGAVSGYGRGNDGDRTSTSIGDGMMGAGFGAAFGGAAPIAGAGIKKLVEWVKNTDTNTIAKTFGISTDAAKALKPDLEALDFGQAKANLAKAGPDAMIADAGIPTREALDSAITGGGKAARVGIDAVSRRAADAGAKLDKVMDFVLGAPKGIKSAAKSISARTAKIREAAYSKAYGSAIDYADDAGRKIEDVLGKIPDGTLNAAIKEANDAMKANGVTNMQIMAEIADDGSVKFVEMPNVQQLDEIKKALGVVGSEVDTLGRPTAKARRAMKLAGELKTAVGEAVPAYGKAVKLGGDKIAEDKALDMGRKVFGPSVTREDVVDMMKDASVEAKDAARQGIREFIDNTLSRVRRDFDAPEVDTQETLKLLGQISSRDARTKIGAVLGEGKAARLFTEIDAIGKQFGTRRAIATGSATGRRVARASALDELLQPGPVGNFAKGSPVKSLQSFVSFLTRQTPENEMARKQEILAEIATALTAKRGPQAEAALKIVQDAIEGQPIKTADAVRIGRLVTGATGVGGYLSATKSQPTSQPAPR